MLPSKLIFRLTILVVSLLAFPEASSRASQESTDPISKQDREFFEKEVRPILVKRCFECHGGSEAQGGLSLASRMGWMAGGDSGPAIKPGASEDSLLVDAINHNSIAMPPIDRGGKLPSHEIAVLTKWVDMGAPDPRDGGEVVGGMTTAEAKSWWAFQPLREIPPRSIEEDVKTVDALIKQQIVDRGLNEFPKADSRTLLRRISYGLTGLPPTWEEIKAFQANPSEESWSREVDRLLDSPEYGVHWGRHWLDVVRYADTAGENADHPLPHAWQYRNWVMDAIQRDLSYREFVRLQLAGDLFTREKSQREYSDGITATGYLAIARRFGHDSDKDMYLTYEDAIDNIGKTFLGLTISCARCHDHKYDPITAEDYYALYGILESSKFAFPGCEAKGQPRDLVPTTSPAEMELLLRPWREQAAKVEAERNSRLQSAQNLRDSIKSLMDSSKQTLFSANLPEASLQSFEKILSVRKGEAIILSVSPNANHGADSTLVQLAIRHRSEGDSDVWSTDDLIDTFTTNNPITAKGSVWAFVQMEGGSVKLLSESAKEINGRTELSKWSLGDTPSVFVNSSKQPVDVWTSLAAQSLFVHPGPSNSVAIIWTSPVDSEVIVNGRVADAHPAALDGISVELAKIENQALGSELAKLGDLSGSLPTVPPTPVMPVAYAVVDGQVKNARLQERGDPEKLGREVARRWLSVFGGAVVRDETSSGRRELSEWISESPLAARVMVNRIWEWHFGKGLVRSSNDFGAKGEKPTQPELLEFLAVRFVQSGYSIKSMHRLILKTNAYQRVSEVPNQLDSENRWLAHFNRRRLTAEELRDSLLMMSGELDRERGTSHPFPPESTWRFTQHQPFHAIYETRKRSAFMMVQRQRRHPFLALFDGADPNASTANRQTTTVPTQALYFINDSFFHSQAQSIASNLQTIANEESRLVALYEKLYQRAPTRSEIERFNRFMDQYPGSSMQKWSAYSRVLLTTSEFLYVD